MLHKNVSEGVQNPQGLLLSNWWLFWFLVILSRDHEFNREVKLVWLSVDFGYCD